MSKSTVEKSCWISVVKSWTLWSRLRSICLKKTLPVDWLACRYAAIADSVARPLDPSRQASTTVAPFSASVRAVAPVTIATLLLSDGILVNSHPDGLDHKRMPMLPRLKKSNWVTIHACANTEQVFQRHNAVLTMRRSTRNNRLDLAVRIVSQKYPRHNSPARPAHHSTTQRPYRRSMSDDQSSHDVRTAGSIPGRLTTPDEDAPHTHIFVSSSVVFSLCWWFLLLFHMFNAGFVFLMGVVHVFISQPVVYESGALLRIPMTVLSLAGWTFVVIAVVHFVSAIQLVYFSVRRCHLSFGNEPVTHGRVAAISPSTVSETSQQQHCLSSQLTKSMSHIESLFGFHGKHFEAMLYARQGTEIVLQTYQVEQVSRSVARLWVNNVVVLLTVLNCVYLPLTELAIPHSNRRRRFAAVVIDVILEFSVCVGVPIAVILPYALVFDWGLFLFPDKLGYDDTWFIALLLELRQVLVSSTADYISSVFPHIAIFASLSSIKSLLHRRLRAPSTASQRRSSVTQSYQRKQSTTLSSSHEAARILRRRVRKWLFHAFTILWAIMVVTMEVRARHRGQHASEFEPCALYVNPWSATNLTCSVVHLNCHRLRDGATLTTSLARVERTVLAKLTFSHCAMLTMPVNLHEFPNLLALETFNVSIMDWPVTASISKLHHPHAIQVQLIDTNFTVFPPGLLHDTLPPNLNLLIYRSNLSSLPEDCGDVWTGHRWRYFKIEHTKLKSLPSSVAKMRIRRLSLIDNKITRIADKLFANQSFTGVRLSENPLSSLPENLGDTAGLRQFMAKDTNVSAFPLWLLEWRAKRIASGHTSIVSLSGSPACTSVETDGVWACGEVDPMYSGDFRYDLVVPLRPL